MGAGSSPLEAAYSLRAPIPAGTWRLVADGIIIEPVDVRFDLLWRHAWRHADGSADTELATFMRHFDPLAGGVYEAQPYEETAGVEAVATVAGDQLVFRYNGQSASMAMAYIPNGDGETRGGRIPYIDLPPDLPP